MLPRWQNYSKKELETICVKRYINDLKLTLNGVRIIENKGRNGMYFCELLALDFATWLDPKFKIWVYQTIRDILTQQTKKVASVVTKRQEAIALKERLIKQAKENNNTEALELLEVEHQIQRLRYQQTNALKEFTNQYKMGF